MEIGTTRTEYTTSTQNTLSEETEGVSGSSFLSILNKNEQTETEKLIADLLSLIRTGLTVSELELLEELLDEAENLTKDGIDNADEKKLIDEMLSEIELAIASLMKRVNGEAIIKASKNTKDEVVSAENPFDSRIESIRGMIEELKGGYLSDNDEGKLLDELRTNKKPNFLNQLELSKSQEKLDSQLDKSEEKRQVKDISQDGMNLFESMVEDKYIDNENDKDKNKKV